LDIAARKNPQSFEDFNIFSGFCPKTCPSPSGEGERRLGAQEKGEVTPQPHTLPGPNPPYPQTSIPNIQWKDNARSCSEGYFPSLHIFPGSSGSNKPEARFCADRCIMQNQINSKMF
jgi:hypothetical protein